MVTPLEENEFLETTSVSSVENPPLEVMGVFNVYAKEPLIKENNSTDSLPTNKKLTTSIPTLNTTYETKTTWIISNSTRNETSEKYCENGECRNAAIASWFIAFACIFITSYCVICCMGFTRGGVARDSTASGYQSDYYGGETGGCFSCCQSAGACGCKGLCCTLVLVSIISIGFAIATLYLCQFVCTKLNG